MTNQRKKIAVTIITFLSVFPVFSIQAQTISLPILLKFYALDQDEAENILIKNGYSYYTTQKHDEDFKTINYGHIRSKSVFRAIHFKYFDNSQLVDVIYSTGSQQDYVTLKSQIKEMGFKFSSSYDLDGGPVYVYKNAKMTLYTIKTIQSYSQQTGTNQYYIFLEKEPDYLKALIDK